MFVRHGTFSSFGRATTLAAVAAIALTAVVPSTAQARHYRYHRGGGAAAAAAFAGIVGTGLAIAAAQNRRDYYEDNYGYYGGPVYAPAPVYGYPYYGGGYGGYRSGVPYINGHPIADW